MSGRRKLRRLGAVALAVTIAATLAGFAIGIPSSASTPIYLDTRYSFQARAAARVSRLTMAEKAAQLSTTRAPAIPRLGVQQYTYQSEAQHGINYLGADENNGGGTPKATSFPTNFAATMSWDPGLQVDAVQGITTAIGAVKPKADTLFDAAGTSSTSTSAAALSSSTRAAIKNADLVVLFIGTDNAAEAKDRTTIAMPGNYDYTQTER